MDAYAAQDSPQAFALQREAFGLMIVVGDVLARGVAVARRLPTPVLDIPRRDLNSAFNRLPGEHMALTVQTLRSAHDEAPDFSIRGRAQRRHRRCGSRDGHPVRPRRQPAVPGAVGGTHRGPRAGHPRDHLLTVTDAHAAATYEESQRQADAGYDHMIEFASILAVAIGDTMSAQLPQGGAATSGGSAGSQ